MSDSVTTVPLYLVATISTMNRNGIDSRMSTNRIRKPSTSPPTRPAIAPYRVPITVAITDAKKPISSAVCPPFISWPSSSNPCWSVPSGWPGPGGRSVVSGLNTVWLV